ncbi:MAG: NAD-dependent dehydratase [Candidatus Marinimicrobia bacterium]|nr:NAD-dependent dehydratase [Candidatus Neomarinimicrobiota bacterium]
MKKKIKHFLVTGGTGFLGSNICKLLIKKGYKVTIFDNNHRGNLDKISEIRNKINFIKGDIRNKKDLKKSVKKIDAIIHLAYINGTKYFYTKPHLVLDVAIKGLINLFDICISYKIRELYLASSSEVYQTPSTVPTKETEMLKVPDIFNPRLSYGGGKILTELMGINYGRKFFKKLIIFRPHNVYGPKMGNEHVIPEFIQRIKKIKGKTFQIQGKGHETRSFIYIDDFINAFDLLIRKGKHLNVYNIGTKETISIRNLAKKISKIFGKKINIKTGYLSQGSTKVRTPDIKKIRNLGFKQNISLNNGIGKLKK